jgi:recombination protein RecT
VFEGDEFTYSLGLRPDIQHVPATNERLAELKIKDKDRQLTHVYAVAYIKDMSHPRVEVMSRADVDAIMGRSAAAKGKSSPWGTDYSEMARKTVLKRLCKTLPLSPEIAEHINRDERVGHLVELGDGEFLIEDVGSIHERVEPKPEPEPDRKVKEIKKPPVETVDKETGEITEQPQPSLLDD